MKKLIISTLLAILFCPEVFAETQTFKTFTPFTPQQYYNYNYGHNPNYYPMMTPSSVNSANYNDYNNYRKRRNAFRFFNNMINKGQMTGYTPSFNYNNYPYGYQQSNSDSNGNYNYNNFDRQNGVKVQILD